MSASLIKGRCVLCKTSRDLKTNYLCALCASDWIIDYVLGISFSLEELIKKGTPIQVVESAEFALCTIPGCLLEASNMTRIIPYVLGVLSLKSLQEQESYINLHELRLPGGASPRRAKDVLNLMAESGLIAEVDERSYTVRIEEDSPFAQIIRMAKVDQNILAEEFVLVGLAGYIYLRAGITPIYLKFLKGKPLFYGDGITRLYIKPKEGNRIRIPGHIFSTLLLILSQLHKLHQDERFYEDVIVKILHLRGSVSKKDYLAKIRPLLFGTATASPPLLGKIFKEIDYDSSSFVFEDYLIDERDRIRERGARIRERLRERIRGEE